jgi:hypothetical protein
MEKQDIVIVGIVVFLLGVFAYVGWVMNGKPFPRAFTSPTALTGSEPPPSMAPSRPPRARIPSRQPDTTTGSVNGVQAGKLETLQERLASNPDSKKIELQDVVGSNTTATAYLLREDGVLYHTLVANVPPPPEGSFYQGWLVKTNPRKMYLSTGKLKRLPSGQLFVNATFEQPQEGFDTVLVTLETRDDASPEREVLTGTAE